MKHFYLLISLFFIFLSAYSQDIIDVKRINHIKFDGVVDETSWKDINPLPLTMYTPTHEGQMTEKTEIRIAYDNHYLYLSGIFYDSDPDGIQGNSLLRDGNPGGDFFNVLLDTYNDNENFNTFSTMPSGNRLDAEILNDAEGEQSKIFNQAWNTFWNVKTTQDENGWYAEMRIPFTSLRFTDKNGEVIFGFIAHRLIGRKNERHTFPNIAPDWPMAPWKPSQAHKIKLTGIKRKNVVYVTPYLLGGYEQVSNQNLNSEKSPNSDMEGEAGLDIKFSPGSNATVDLTINTDFAQVEADNVQVNLSRFSLFFPEKRQFFQERSGVFNFQTSIVTQNRLFHSRRIGLSESGDLLRVYGGLRFVGRNKGFDYGVLNMQTEASAPISSENFGVYRVRKRVFNPYSYIGAIATTRVSNNEDYNVVTGVDGLFRLSNPYYLTLKASRLSSNLEESYATHLFYTKLERRSSTGLGFTTELERIEEGFDPGIGFILRNNTAFNQNVVYGVFVDHAVIRKLTPFANSYLYLDNNNLNTETHNLEAGLETSFKSGASWSVSVTRTYDHTQTGFQLSDSVMVLPGKYTFYGAKSSYSMTPGRRLRFSASMETGAFYDGKKHAFTFSPTWNPSKHFEINVSYTFNQVDFDGRDQKLKADIISSSILLAADTHWSLRSLIQYSQLTDNIGVNATLRYNKSEGHDLYIVWNQQQNDPFKEGITNEENVNIRVKYIYTFVW